MPLGGGPGLEDVEAQSHDEDKPQAKSLVNKAVLNMSRSFLIMPGIYILCSSAHSLPQQFSFSGDLLPEMMESETPPPASPSNRADDFEVSSRRVSPDQQAVQGMMKMLPEGVTSVA